MCLFFNNVALVKVCVYLCKAKRKYITGLNHKGLFKSSSEELDLLYHGSSLLFCNTVRCFRTDGKFAATLTHHQVQY